MTTLGDTIYENATPAAARLAGSTTVQRKWLTQTGTGSVSAAPAWTKWPTFNVEDFGASPAGSAGSNVTAINAAFTALLAAGGGCLFFPNLYPVNAQLTFAMNGGTVIYGLAIRGSGMVASGLVFSGSGTNNGIAIPVHSPSTYWGGWPAITVADLSLVCTTAGAGTALSITGDLSAGARSIPGPRITNVDVGAEVSSYWNTGIEINQILNAIIYGCNLAGSSTSGTYGIYFHGANATDEIRVTDSVIVGFDKGFYANGVSNYLEGVYLFNNQILGQNWAIYLDNGSNEGGSVKLIGNYLATLSGGIYTHGFGSCQIIGNQFDPQANGTTGISCYNAFQSNIIGNHIGGNAGTSAIGILVDGDGGGTYNLGTVVEGNVTINVATAVHFTANTGSCQMNSHLDYTSGAYINGNSTNYMIGNAPISATIGSGSAVSLSSGSPANITSLSVPVGTWMITGAIDFIIGASTATQYMIAGSSSSSGAFGAQDTYSQNNYVATGGYTTCQPIPSNRVSLTAATQYYLVAQAGFSVSTVSAYGSITATPSR
jgi:hypothetical protein